MEIGRDSCSFGYQKREREPGLLSDCNYVCRVVCGGMACGDGDHSRLYNFIPMSLGLEQEGPRPLTKEEPGHRTLGSA